jgi:hypothetical protein
VSILHLIVILFRFLTDDAKEALAFGIKNAGAGEFRCVDETIEPALEG